MKEQHVPFDSKNNEPSREEVRAKVEDYRNELIANQLYRRSLSEQTTSSDEEEAQKKDAIRAAVGQYKTIRADYEAFVGPELAAAHDAFEKFSEDDRKEGSNKYDDFKAAEAALTTAEEAFYGKYEPAQTGEKETGLEGDAKDVEEALKLFEKGEPIDPEKLQEVLVAAFGETVTEGLTDRMRERLRTEEKLHDVLERMVANKRGAEIEGSPESIALFKGIFDADDLKASLNGSSDAQKALPVGTQSGDMPTPTSPDAGEDGADDETSHEQGDETSDFVWTRRRRFIRSMGIPAAALGRMSARLFKKHELLAKNSSQRLDDESEEDYYNRMKSHAKTTAAIGALALLGGAAGAGGALGLGTGAVWGLKGAAMVGNIGHSVWQARRKDPTGPNLGAAAAGGVGSLGLGFAGSEMASHHTFGLGLHDTPPAPEKHEAPKVPENKPTNGNNLSPAEAFNLSHKTEMDFLNTNGRVHNDFNNIPVDSPNAPERAGLFHGFDALQNEYQKSPMELSAQLHQIQTIEMANNHHFDALPQNLQLQPGENPDAYVARLSDAIHHDQALHDKLTGATMDYLKAHGQPKPLEQSYYSWWIGKDGVAHWEQQSISSSDPNDVIIKLSETKGIRLPCGQPIELIPVTPHVQQAVYHPPVSHPVSAPAPAPEAPTPIPQPEQPPEVVVPPVTIPPIEIPQPPIPVTPIEGLTPKSTPRPFIPNNHWMGSGEPEGDTPKPVQQNHAPAQVPGLKPAHTQAPPEQASRQGNTQVPGQRAPRH